MNIQSFIKKNGPIILTCLASVGTVATAVIAVRETPKAIKLLEEAKEKKGAELTVIEKVKVAGPVYIPAVATGVGTIACMAGSTVLSHKQTVSMAGAYALASSSFTDYKNKLKELYGEEADAKIREEILKDKYVANPQPIGAECFFGVATDLATECDDKETALFYDDFSQRYFEARPIDVFAAEYHLNRNFSISGEANPNEFYEFLGIPKIEGGSAVGWSAAYGYCWVDFEHKKVTLDGGLECYIIYPTFQPEDEYLNL